VIRWWQWWLRSWWKPAAPRLAGGLLGIAAIPWWVAFAVDRHSVQLLVASLASAGSIRAFIFAASQRKLANQTARDLFGAAADRPPTQDSI